MSESRPGPDDVIDRVPLQPLGSPHVRTLLRVKPATPHPTVEQLATLGSTSGIPDGFITLAGTSDGDPEALLAEEREGVQRAVPARQREFAAGRLMARDALRTLGGPPGPIVAARDRSPIWPAGFVGSISHAGGACVVSVGRGTVAASLGLDVEVDEALPEGVARLVCRPAELAQLAVHGEHDIQRTAKAVFSTKEAVYKCLYPLTGIFLQFHDVEVELEFDADRFVARVLHPALSQGPYGRLVGRVVRGQGWIVCAVSVPPLSVAPACATRS